MKKRPFIVLYFAVIFLVFLAALLRSPSPSFNKYYLGSQADTRYELKDDSNIAFVFQISQNDLIGLYLNDYSSNGLTFKDEYIEVSVTDYVTMEQYQAASVWLSDQISEKNIFIPFDREYAPGTKLLVQLKSHGLFSKGILLGLSKTKSYGNITWIKGRLQKSRFICAEGLSHSGLVSPGGARVRRCPDHPFRKERPSRFQQTKTQQLRRSVSGRMFFH